MGSQAAVEDEETRSPVPRTATPIQLQAQEEEDLWHLARQPTVELRLSQRAQVILHAAQGQSNQQIRDQFGFDLKTIRKWRSRYLRRREEKPQSSVGQRLTDADRPGRPPKFSEFFFVDLVAIATSKPEDSQRPVTHWTSWELAEEVVLRRMTTSIHRSTISRFLAECKLQPHRVKGWMNRKEDPEFEPRAHGVKELLVQAQKAPCPEHVVVSFDEKTGMQAKERIAPDQPMAPGRPTRQEFEYQRHGTLVLFAMMLVHTGEVLARTRPNRPNTVTADVLRSLLQDLLTSGYKRISVVLDQLNTHWSEDLVKVVAQMCGLAEPASESIRTGDQRRAWLEDPTKPIVFHFTPKHASWLNPVETWFSVLVRKVLRRGSFRSTADLEEKVHRFIDYFNEKLARPYRLNAWRSAA